MGDRAQKRASRHKLQKGASYPGLEIIAKLATVLEVEPAELLKLPASTALPARPDTG